MVPESGVFVLVLTQNYNVLVVFIYLPAMYGVKYVCSFFFILITPFPLEVVTVYLYRNKEEDEGGDIEAHPSP